MAGWIKLQRKLLDNPIWTCEHFSRGQAWVDLIFLANYEFSFFYKRGVKIEVQTGQVARSEVELADRWKWSRTKVRKFINDLEKEQQVIRQKSNVTQLLTIVNYEEYQKKEQQTGQQKDSRKTAERQQKNTLKEEEEYKEEKEEDISYDFGEFWEDYEKKVGEKNKIEKKWKTLKEEERLLIKEHVKRYKLSTPDKKFRKNPETYLNNKSWLDEIITDSASVKSNVKQWFNPDPPEYNSKGIRLE